MIAKRITLNAWYSHPTQKHLRSVSEVFPICLPPWEETRQGHEVQTWKLNNQRNRIYQAGKIEKHFLSTRKHSTGHLFSERLNFIPNKFLSWLNQQTLLHFTRRIQLAYYGCPSWLLLWVKCWLRFTDLPVDRFQGDFVVPMHCLNEPGYCSHQYLPITCPAMEETKTTWPERIDFILGKRANVAFTAPK